jgi:hypothetical protein
MGVLLAEECATGVQIEGAPKLSPLPATARPSATRLSVEYAGLPAAAPGDTVTVTVRVEGQVTENTALTIEGPPGWTVVPNTATVGTACRVIPVALHAPVRPAEWPMRNLFSARLATDPPLTYTFGVAGAGLWQLLGVYYDALPDEDDPVQQRRRFNQHFVSLQRPYLPEPNVDVAGLYQAWSRKLGQPALVSAYEREINLSRLVGLRGPYCAYLARTIISPDERPVYLVIGNNDGYRLYLNGELVAEVDETVWWVPFNNAHRVTLRRGPNHLLVKLLKRGDDLKFTLGLRADTGKRHHNVEDWLVDLADGMPG